MTRPNVFLSRLIKTVEGMKDAIACWLRRLSPEWITAVASVIALVGAAVAASQLWIDARGRRAASAVVLGEMCDELAGPAFSSDLRLRPRSIDELSAFRRRLDEVRNSGYDGHETHPLTAVLYLHEARFERLRGISPMECGSADCERVIRRIQGAALYSIWAEGRTEAEFNTLVAYYDDWASSDQDDGYPLAIKASMLLMHGPPSAAENVILDALRRPLNRARAYEVQGRIQAARADYASAMKSFDEALRLEPMDVAARINAANLLARGETSDVYAAIRRLETVCVLDPFNATARYNLGICAMKLKRHTRAVEYFDAAIALDPADPTAYIGRADALIALGRFQEALSSADSALDRDETRPAAWHNRSVANRLSGHPTIALADAERAIELKDPDEVKIRKVAAYAAHQAGEHEKERDHATAAVELNDDDGEALVLLSQARRECKDSDGAMAAADRALAVNSKDANGWLAKGFASASKGGTADRALALQCFREAQSRGSMNARAYVAMGQLLRQAGRPLEAASSLKRAIALDSNDADAWYELGATLLDLGHCEDAVAAMDSSAKLDAYDAKMWYGCARAREGCGRWEEALVRIETACGLEPGSGQLHAFRAEVLHELGRHGEAARAYESALESDPANDAWISGQARELQHQASQSGSSENATKGESR
ncbi:MAG: tetratricopeptide repeat protein [Planctomycetes bacterium]|nr:tetratricopeptide repeat protein [Planctomycetota bacterium]